MKRRKGKGVFKKKKMNERMRRNFFHQNRQVHSKFDVIYFPPVLPTLTYPLCLPSTKATGSLGHLDRVEGFKFSSFLS